VLGGVDPEDAALVARAVALIERSVLLGHEDRLVDRYEVERTRRHGGG
jgi:hypothetical protein